MKTISNAGILRKYAATRYLTHLQNMPVSAGSSGKKRNYFHEGDRQWHEKDNITSPGDQSNNVNDTGSPAGTPPSDRNDTRTDGNQPARLPDSPVPGLLHDVLQSYLIGQQKTSQFLISQNPSSIKSQKDLIGQLPNESNDVSSILESEKGQTLTEKDLEVLNFENLTIESETDPNKSSYVTEKKSDTHKVVPGSIETDVNNSHLSQATCEGDLSNDQVGDKNVNKQGNRGEKLHLETSTAVKGDTVINNNPCSDNNLYLTNKPLSELNVKSKCLSFGHTRHSLGEDKFSTPGRKLNSDTTNTATAVQHRSSTLEFYEEKALRNASKSFEASKLLKHEFSDLSSYYTARSDFGSDFYGFSASSFVTCQEFLTPGPKSRFTKAKEIFLQGRKYVKAKFSNYQKRLRSSHSARNRKCGATCGFPCFFLGREVSQFSFGIPECSLVKGNNHDNIEEKGDYSKCNNDLSDEEEEFFTSDNITMSENYKIPENHMINHVTNINGFQDGCSGLENRPDNSFKEDCRNGNGRMASTVGQTTDHIMTVKVKPEPAPGSSVGDPVARESSVDREPGRVTMATDEAQDDLPVGTEAGTITTDQRESILRSENESEEKPTNKRLRWVSAMDKTQSSSLHSSTTSNSSVEQFLSDREMDPEKMLKNLGFGFSPDTDLSCGRIPDRFLLSPSSADGIDLYKFVLNHPDLHHLLWMWDKKTDTQSTSGAMSNQSTGRKSGQCTSLNNQVTSSNKTETQSVSRAGNQKVGQGHCARQDNMVVDNENGWGIYNSDNKENVCDITDSNIARLKQYVETLYARSNASDASLDQLESVPDRYFHNVDKNSAGHRKKKITLDLFDVGNSDLKDKIDIDGTKDNSLVNDSIKPGETDFPKLANASGSENRKGIDNIFRGKRVLLGDDKMESSYKEVNDREHQKTDGSDVDKKTLLPEIDEEDNKPANDSESAGDFKSFGSWSSDSNESLQDVYNVELDENESLV